MHKRSAFTLVEVMVAVIIVSVVIAALLQMQGATTHKFFGIKKIMKTSQYSSFLLRVSHNYGFESSKLNMRKLVDEFELENDLRRRLKSMKVEIDYEKLTTIEMSEFDNSQELEQSSSSGLVFEIGKTSLKMKDFTIQLIRVKIQ